jgi:hypothetical protein
MVIMARLMFASGHHRTSLFYLEGSLCAVVHYLLLKRGYKHSRLVSIAALVVIVGLTYLALPGSVTR